MQRCQTAVDPRAPYRTYTGTPRLVCAHGAFNYGLFRRIRHGAYSTRSVRDEQPICDSMWVKRNERIDQGYHWPSLSSVKLCSQRELETKSYTRVRGPQSGVVHYVGQGDMACVNGARMVSSVGQVGILFLQQ
jgi:hypothetical protein